MAKANCILVLVISTLAPDRTQPLSYTSSRSVFTFEERLEQTLLTVASITKFVPVADILILDNSPTIDVTKLKWSENVRFVHCSLSAASSPHKSVAEAQGTLTSFDHFDEKKYDLIFKISGRYQFNAKFKMEQIDQKQFTFTKFENDKFATVLYAVPKCMIQKWKKAVQNIYNLQSSLGYESLMYQELNQCAHIITEIGVEGLISVDGKFCFG